MALLYEERPPHLLVAAIGPSGMCEARFHRISGYDVQFQFIPVTVGIEF